MNIISPYFLIVGQRNSDSVLSSSVPDSDSRALIWPIKLWLDKNTIIVLCFLNNVMFILTIYLWFLRPRLHGSEQMFAWTKTYTVPPCVYTGPAELDEFFERLSVQVWGLKKAGQLFDRHGIHICTESCKHPNRATFCSDSAVMAWN